MDQSSEENSDISESEMNEYGDKSYEKLKRGDSKVKTSNDTYRYNDIFVWPWRRILVNLPITYKDGRYVEESGSKMREEFTWRGFNPVRVRPLWNYRAHFGSAVVEFTKNWPRFKNAMSFEKALDADHHGKRDWLAKKHTGSSIYGWVAREDEYRYGGIIREDLQKTGDLKTISDIVAEEEQKKNKLLSNLTNVIEIKNKHLKEMKCKYTETSVSFSRLMVEKDELHQSYNESMYLHISFILYMYCQKATLEQKMADENVLKLADDHQRQKEELHKRIIQLETKPDAKQALELEIERLKETLEVMKHMGGEDDAEGKKKDASMKQDLEEKTGDLEDFESLNQTLIVKERNSNDELQMLGLKEMSGRAQIGVKRMGDLNNKPFINAFCSVWDEHLRNSAWHPFKIITVDEKTQVPKHDLGEEVCRAVTTALKEINEYNPSGRYIYSCQGVCNFKEKRKTTLKGVG
ncbi:hypothetical protein NE237_015312 [Protea cynaroides]|uniref:Uncharacterized protein n=1 Tax=Protea cynaroides TaxID=273540 RepID=A0A9Q0KE22_9MAGN|nr:hypothetical protein NE237_015312 [Protea cynaroides]